MKKFYLVPFFVFFAPILCYSQSTYDSMVYSWKSSALYESLLIIKKSGVEMSKEYETSVEKYIDCLYSKLTDEDVRSIISGVKTISDILNVKYVSNQNKCYELAFNERYEIEEYDPDWHESFYLARVVSYYSGMNKIKINSITKSLDCIKNKMSPSQIKSIEEWHNKEMNSTQILLQYKYLEEMIKACLE